MTNDEEIEFLRRLNNKSEEAIIALSKFVRATGAEIEDVKKASMHLTEAIRDMNKTLIEIKKYIITKDQ